MSNFYQGVNIKSISLFILTIITLAACSKQDPTNSDIFIGKDIPNWKTTTGKVAQFEFEITHQQKTYKFRFISSTKGYVNDKLYYRQ